MTGVYYTTQDIKEIFQWRSDDTIAQKRKSGFLPEPDIKGRPNKWLKTKIDAIINPNSETQSNEP